MILTIIFPLLFSLPPIDSQLNYRPIPPNFDLTIRQWRQHSNGDSPQLQHFEHLLNMPAKLREWLETASFDSTKAVDCAHDLETLFQAVAQNHLWALKILDSWGKPLPSGLLKGNVLWTGNYDECLEPLYQPSNKSFVKQPLTTQYCTLLTDPSKAGSFISSSIVLGLCLPSSCNDQSLSSFIETIFNNTNGTDAYLRCPNNRSNGKTDRLAGTIAISIVLGLLVLLVLVGTVTDALSSLLQERMPPTSTIAEFSAIRTLRFIFTMKKKANDDSFLFINGIRVLSLFWVIFGHSFLFEIYYTMNNVDVLAWSHNLAFQLILRGLLSVDTFFVLSGFLTAVLFLRQVTKEGLSSRFMFMYYVHRYIRLTPTFILVMFTSMYLTPYMGRGPMYPSEQGFESEACHQHHYWWTSFFYIGNLIKPDNTCLSVSWYLFNDMQFHWIAPLALIPFAMGRKRIGFGIATCFVLASIASIAGLLLHYPHIYPNTIGNALQQPASANDPTFFNVIYVTPWCRMAPYAIGLLTGFITFNNYGTRSLSVLTRLAGSIVAILLGLVCIFAVYQDYILVSGLNRASIIAYEALSRTAWSSAIGWLLFVCSLHQEGVVNTILSWPIWTPLTRLNYATYLIHLTIIYMTVFNQTMPFYYQPLTVINNYVAQLVFSYAAAIPVVIFIEAPFTVLEKKLFKRKSARGK